MVSRSNAALPGKKFWTSAALMAAALVVFAPAARAEGFFDIFEPSPNHVQRDLADAGFEMRRPMIRRGNVYVCDVKSESGENFRLVVDARTGEILERFPAQRVRRAQRDDNGAFAVRDGWDGPPRPPGGIEPRPGILGLFLDDPEDAPPRRLDSHEQTARGDFIPQGVTNGEDPRAMAPRADKPKHTAKHKVAPAIKAASTTVEPAASSEASTAPQAVGVAPDNVAPQPVMAPSAAPGAAAAPVIEQPQPTEAAKSTEAVTPADTHKPADAPKPLEAAKPAEPANPTAAAKPVAPAPPVAEAKAAEPAKPVVEVKAVSAPHSASKTKAVNDLPVTPLD